MLDYLRSCEAAARLGGEVLRSFAGKIAYREKGKHDLVTAADLASQQAIREFLLAKYPAHDFLGEEDADAISAAGRRGTSPYRWVVDPLDGTANFVHSLGNYAVSIALQHEHEIICGAVYDPILNECFAAAKGHGATLNGQPIRVSGCATLDAAMIAASFSPHVARGSIEIERFIAVLEKAQSIRRLGSAALNLCYVAAGRLDGYWATSVKLWDIAAGMLILTEAGGVMTDLNHGPVNFALPEFAATSSPALQTELLDTLANS